MFRRENDIDLSVVETVKGVPRDVVKELRLRHADSGRRAAEFRKARLNLAEERLYREEIARYQGFEGLLAELETARADAKMAHDELAKAHREIEQLKQRLEQATAEPALAVHSRPTGR
jgi:hypothetical protein